MKNKYYYPDGTSIDQTEFLNYYSKFYYWLNSKHIENDIISILQKEEKLELDDINKILSWKMGRIKHKDSEDNEKFIFYKDWEGCNDVDESKVFVRGIELDLGIITKKMNKLSKGNRNINDYLKVFNQTDGIGPVYAVTLMSFNTNGKYPIYDHYAASALSMITGGQFVIKEPTYDNMEGIYMEYCRVIDDVFCAGINDGDAAPEELRRLDQALWTYGHCINIGTDTKGKS